MKPALRLDLGLLLLRLILGVVFAFHGAQKLFGWFDGGGISGTAEAFDNMGIPAPQISAVLAGATEFLGGLALILGVAVPLAAIPLTITMLVAAIHVHGDAFSARKNGMEYPLTLAVASASLGLTGAGRLRIRLGGPKPE